MMSTIWSYSRKRKMKRRHLKSLGPKLHKKDHSEDPGLRKVGRNKRLISKSPFLLGIHIFKNFLYMLVNVTRLVITIKIMLRKFFLLQASIKQKRSFAPAFERETKKITTFEVQMLATF